MKEQHPGQQFGSEIKDLQKLDLLTFTQSIRSDSKDQKVWDPVRQKWIKSNPEEVVRLSLIYLLHEQYAISFRRMASERGIKADRKRFDLLTFDDSGHPHILVECKSPEVPLHMDHIIQLGEYNRKLNAKFALLTNGLRTLLFNLESGEFLEALSDCFDTNL